MIESFAMFMFFIQNADGAWKIDGKFSPKMCQNHRQKSENDERNFDMC